LKKKDISYLQFDLEDSSEEKISRSFTKTFQFIDNAFKSYEESKLNRTLQSDNDKKVEKTFLQAPRFLVHCNLGVSRSSTILIAYLISKYNICTFGAYSYIKDKRIQVSPNYNFLRQLKLFENQHLKL
jgi:predicted protein tyrosine phosphatase